MNSKLFLAELMGLSAAFMVVASSVHAESEIQWEQEQVPAVTEPDLDGMQKQMEEHDLNDDNCVDQFKSCDFPRGYKPEDLKKLLPPPKGTGPSPAVPSLS